VVYGVVFIVTVQLAWLVLFLTDIYILLDRTL